MLGSDLFLVLNKLETSTTRFATSSSNFLRGGSFVLIELSLLILMLSQLGEESDLFFSNWQKFIVGAMFDFPRSFSRWILLLSMVAILLIVDADFGTITGSFTTGNWKLGSASTEGAEVVIVVRSSGDSIS